MCHQRWDCKVRGEHGQANHDFASWRSNSHETTGAASAMPKKVPRAPRGLRSCLLHGTVLIPKDGLELSLATLSHNTSPVPLDFETVLVHTKWTETQMHRCFSPLQNYTGAYSRVVPLTPAKWRSFAFGNEAVQRLAGSIQRAL